MSKAILYFCGILFVYTTMWFFKSLSEVVKSGLRSAIIKNMALSSPGEPADAKGLLSSEACILLHYDPWDSSIIPYVDQNYNPLKGCDHNFKPTTTVRNGTVEIHKKNVFCWGRCLERRNDTSNKPEEWLHVNETNFQCDILETKCGNADNTDIYRMVHAQIVEKSGSKIYNTEEDGTLLYNIYVILLDSHSSAQATRNLPQTMHFLEKSMQAVSFPHVNKVGLNSWPNGIALWFGKRVAKVHGDVYGFPDVEPDWPIGSHCQEYVDNETFIFKEFSARGYKTMLAEDWMLGLLNWPNCFGFKDQPTDHYMRPFQVALEKEASETLRRTYTKLNCIEQHQDILRYLQNFINSYKGIPKFGWIWLSRLGHDDESGTVHADADFQRFLLRNKKELENSFFVIMGDHGMRGSEITRTKLGILEMNSAMFSISVPKNLRHSTTILATLRENAKRLQTMFDIRATLIDILKNQPKTNFADREYKVIEGEYGTSLLRSQSAAERSCKSLLIPLAYCICQYTMKEINRTADTAIAAGNFLVDKVNAIVKEQNVSHMCETLRLERIISISAYVPENETKTYNVVVKVQSPCDGIFTAIIRRGRGEFELNSPTIERLDHFGSKGDCVRDTMKKLCHCKS